MLQTETQSISYVATVRQEKKGVEGSLFVFERRDAPQYGFFIMNRLNIENIMELVTPNMRIKISDPYLLYKNPLGMGMMPRAKVDSQTANTPGCLVYFQEKLWAFGSTTRRSGSGLPHSSQSMRLLQGHCALHPYLARSSPFTSTRRRHPASSRLFSPDCHLPIYA